MEKKQTIIVADQKERKLWPYKALILAPSGGGKSYLCFRDLLPKLSKSGNVDIFHIIIFSKTVRSDPPQLQWIDYCEKIYRKRFPPQPAKLHKKLQHYPKNQQTYQINNTSESVNMEWLQDLYKFQKELADMKKPFNNYLIVLDDCFSEQFIKKPTTFILDLFTIGRHYGLNILLLLQSYQSALNPVCRRQLTDFYLGRLNNQYDIDTILEQFSAQMKEESTRKNMKIMMAMYNIANYYIAQGFGFLHVSCEKIFGQGRFEISCTDIYLDCEPNLEIVRQFSENNVDIQTAIKQLKKNGKLWIDKK